MKYWFIHVLEKEVNEENSKRLTGAFPGLYGGSNKTEGGSPRAFIFECGDGWFSLIFQLSESITKAALNADVQIPVVRQVKSKFGGLLYYVSGVDDLIEDDVDEFIAETEEESSCDYEICGKPGSQNHNGWFVTVCKEHVKQ